VRVFCVTCGQNYKLNINYGLVLLLCGWCVMWRTVLEINISEGPCSVFTCVFVNWCVVWCCYMLL